MNKDEERLARYRKLPDEIKELYSSKLATALNDEMIAKYNIPDDKVGAYIDATGDVVVGLNKIADLPRLLQGNVGLTPEVAQKITAELIDAWEPVVAREHQTEQGKKESISSLADKIAAIKPTDSVTPTAAAVPAAEASTVESVPEPIEPAKSIRTMQGDMEKIHGYGALQQQTANETDDEPVVKATPQDELRSGE